MDAKSTRTTAEIQLLPADERTAQLVISGVPAAILKQPGKLQKIMDLLELPHGTSAKVTYIASEVITR